MMMMMRALIGEAKMQQARLLLQARQPLPQVANPFLQKMPNRLSRRLRRLLCSKPYEAPAAALVVLAWLPGHLATRRATQSQAPEYANTWHPERGDCCLIQIQIQMQTQIQFQIQMQTQMQRPSPGLGSSGCQQLLLLSKQRSWR